MKILKIVILLIILAILQHFAFFQEKQRENANLKQGGHWGDSGFARVKLVSTDRLVLSGLHYTNFYNNYKNMVRLEHKGFDFEKT